MDSMTWNLLLASLLVEEAPAQPLVATSSLPLVTSNLPLEFEWAISSLPSTEKDLWALRAELHFD
jgi:hypothetical protein